VTTLLLHLTNLKLHTTLNLGQLPASNAEPFCVNKLLTASVACEHLNPAAGWSHDITNAATLRLPWQQPQQQLEWSANERSIAVTRIPESVCDRTADTCRYRNSNDHSTHFVRDSNCKKTYTNLRRGSTALKVNVANPQ